MNPIPCSSCERPNECRRDRRCNRPCGIEHAAKELEEANQAFRAAGERVTAALIRVLAATEAIRVIHKAQE